MDNQAVQIQEMKATDYQQLVYLWQQVEGILLPAKEEPEDLGRFLDRNPGLSFVAISDQQIVGAILCGYDGLYGYIHRAAVSPFYQGSGIGGMLVERCLQNLAEQSINRVRLTVSMQNKLGQAFWEHMGWQECGESKLMAAIN